MYIANVTKDHDNITSSNYTHYDNVTLTIRRNNKNNIEIRVLAFTIVPCGMSLVCLISLMVYTLLKTLINNK